MANRNQFFRTKIKKFYLEHKREFFWRKDKLNPFQIMIVELFLKKTKAEMVDGRIRDFVKKYRTSEILLGESRARICNKVASLGLGAQRTTALKAIASAL